MSQDTGKAHLPETFACHLAHGSLRGTAILVVLVRMSSGEEGCPHWLASEGTVEKDVQVPKGRQLWTAAKAKRIRPSEAAGKVQGGRAGATCQALKVEETLPLPTPSRALPGPSCSLTPEPLLTQPRACRGEAGTERAAAGQTEPSTASWEARDAGRQRGKPSPVRREKVLRRGHLEAPERTELPEGASASQGAGRGDCLLTPAGTVVPGVHMGGEQNDLIPLGEPEHMFFKAFWKRDSRPSSVPGITGPRGDDACCRLGSLSTDDARAASGPRAAVKCGIWTDAAGTVILR